jgi:hypothetical protein
MGLRAGAGSFGNSNDSSNATKHGKFIGNPRYCTLLNKKPIAARIYKYNIVFGMD